MAVYPLGLLSPDKPEQQSLIDYSLKWLEKTGTRNWCGYSFSWAASIYARAKQADQAASMLKIFASNFCSINSFHLNGDQKGGQYSSFTYAPFTLEGNFAFAQGIHEMLLQSYNGYIEVFPAIPNTWKSLSFKHLRTEGAFLVSAKMENGNLTKIEITASENNLLVLKIPFTNWNVQGILRSTITDNGNNIWSVHLKKGQKIIFTPATEKKS